MSNVDQVKASSGTRRAWVLGVLASAMIVLALGLGLLLSYDPEWLTLDPDGEAQRIGRMVLSTILLLCASVWLACLVVTRLKNPSPSSPPGTGEQTSSANANVSGANAETVALVKEHLRLHYGLFWRQRLRVLLVIGDPEQIEAAVPGLADKQWLEGQGAVLLWGGSAQPRLSERAARWKRLCRRRALDGVVWVLGDSQQTDDVAMAVGVGQLLALSRNVKWQLPLHVLQVCRGEWPQIDRERQAIGCRFPDRCTAATLESDLQSLAEPLRQRGLAQMREQMSHDFFLRLSRDLYAEGAERWRQPLAPLLRRLERGAPLRGLWFSSPTVRSEASGHVWPKDPAWDGMLGKWKRGTRIGWPVTRVGGAVFVAVATVWCIGLLVSFANNRALLAEAQATWVALQASGQRDAQVIALNDLTRVMQRLDDYARQGQPWRLRFGLSQGPALLDTLWPRYAEAHHRLLRDPTVAGLRQKLQALIDLPPDSLQRAGVAHDAYLQLEAYLMLARPGKADARFLAETLGHPASPDDVMPDVQDELSARLWAFYVDQLPHHPEWRLDPDQALITHVRHALIQQLKHRNDERRLYQHILEAAARHYGDLNVEDLVAGTDSRRLFVSETSVPGVFTRQAWEGQIRQAIDDMATAHREQMDWVLTDHPETVDERLTPDALRQRLTQRYFEDYAGAWLALLNGLCWQETAGLSDVVEQLTLMSDPRRSPLVALLNSLVWHGQAGSASLNTPDMQQAGQVDVLPSATAGPLEPTFGSWLALMGNASDEQSINDHVSLQSFLNQVTRVRLKLQQANNAADPQRITQALMQSVFQGRASDLTDARSQGELIAASLGAEWAEAGQTLFLAPLEQAWQQVLQRSTERLNRQWQDGVVTPWNAAFTGRYPFAAGGSDASLPLLGTLIRADSGRIEQFLQQQLSGVLRKEGNRWVVDSTHDQGLRFNPAFLSAINELAQLADVLYPSGVPSVSFELQGKPVRDVVQTTFILNGARHQYFNQKERWQRFVWPGHHDYPGASLSWTSVHSGERLYGDFQGTWGLVRLLDKAEITPVDDSRYRVVLKAPDGLKLTWFLRTELGAGPMSLLKLRQFKLPKQIFLSEQDASPPTAHGEADS